MSKRIKLFEENNMTKLQENMNEFLEDIEADNIVINDIKYNHFIYTTHFHDGGIEDQPWYTGMIVYNDDGISVPEGTSGNVAQAIFKDAEYKLSESKGKQVMEN